MTLYVKLELTTYLLSIDDRRHTIFSFIEQCQYCLVNIVVDKDNTFPVPADFKSAVKKSSTYENGGFVIPL